MTARWPVLRAGGIDSFGRTDPLTMIRLLTVAVSSLLLLGCSQSSTAAAGMVRAQDQGLLVVDTAADTDLVLVVRLAAVALQRADGSLTANLLPVDAQLKLTDPDGGSGEAVRLSVPGGPHLSEVGR